MTRGPRPGNGRIVNGRIIALEDLALDDADVLAALDELQVRLDDVKPDDYDELCDALDRLAALIRVQSEQRSGSGKPHRAPPGP